MPALGMIETRGLLAAIECADVMLKAAQVTLKEQVKVGGGLVTTTIEGDVGAVKAAVDAGASAVLNMGDGILISQHVIPRPHETVEALFGSDPPPKPPVPPTQPDPPVKEKASPAVKQETAVAVKKVQPAIPPPKAEAAPQAEVVSKVEIAPKAEAAPQAEAAPKAEVAPKVEVAPKAEVAPAFPQGKLTKKVVDEFVKKHSLPPTMAALKAAPIADLRALARDYKEIGLTGKKLSSAKKALLLEKLEGQYTIIN